MYQNPLDQFVSGQPQGQQQPEGQPKKPRGIVIPGFNPAGGRNVEDAAGQQAQVLNLKDHPELDGQRVALIGRPSIRQGDNGEYIVFPAVLLDDDNQPTGAIAIMTGSANVMERVIACKDASPQAPYFGRLRAGGRAWFLD